MTNSDHTSFQSHVAVHHQSLRPSPILPVNYSFFLFIDLPPSVVTAPFDQQVAAVREAMARRLAYPGDGPFGKILAFEFRRSASDSFYFDRLGTLLAAPPTTIAERKTAS